MKNNNFLAHAIGLRDSAARKGFGTLVGLGRMLRMARAALDESQSDVAGRAEVTESTLKGLECAERLPHPDTLRRVIQYYQREGVAFEVETGAVRLPPALWDLS